MSSESSALKRVAYGELVRMEMYQKALKDAGIECSLTGDELEAGLGSALPSSIELWVHGHEAAKAEAAIAKLEEDRGHAPRQHVPHGPQRNDPKPGQPPTHGPHTHYNPDPRS